MSESKKQEQQRKDALLALLPPARTDEFSSPSEAFAAQLLRQTVAQILLSTHVTKLEHATFLALVEATRRKLLELGSALKQVAERSKRTQVTLDDYLELGLAKTKPTKASATGSSESLADLTFLAQIPAFPVQLNLEQAAAIPSQLHQQQQASAATSGEGEALATCGLLHLPPFPPQHTYKRTKLTELAKQTDIPSSTVNELRRVQQRHVALVREAIARMKSESKA